MTGPTATTTGHGLAGRAASMIKEGKSVGCRRQTARRRAELSAQGAVLSRLPRSGELDGLSHAAGGCEHSRRVDRRLAQRATRRAEGQVGRLMTVQLRRALPPIGSK